MQSRSQLMTVASSIQLQHSPWESGKVLNSMYYISLVSLPWFCVQREGVVKQKLNFKVMVF